MRELAADGAARGRIARSLDLMSLESLTAELRLSGWFDGLKIEGRWRADATQTCGVSLEDFPVVLEGTFDVRVVPASSPHAAVIEEPEIEVDLEADDPPDVLESDVIDLGGYVVEHLALEIDPFPRKPGATFEPPEPTVEISPFAILRNLKGSEPTGSS
ncbi:MAG TPA: DUF177 domain-containing protein [Caulobacteraceae bacterium]